MPAPQAYKPPSQYQLILTISPRRNPRSGRLHVKFAPKKSQQRRPIEPATTASEICSSPRRA
jgi:hypothetical protein